MHIGSSTLNPGTVTISSVTAKIQDSAGNALTSTGGALDVNASIDTTGLATDAGQTTGNAFLGTIAGAVSGTEMQVDVLSMPTVAVTGTFWQATQPVSLASVPSHEVTNAGTFAVQSATTLNAETTKVIGVVRNADGSGNLLTSTSNALDVNIASSDLTSLTTATGTRDANTLRVTVATDDSVPVTGTFWQATQPVSGTVTANATLAAETTKVIGTVRVASGGIASGAIASGALASGSIVDGAMVTLGAKADNKSTATDTTSVSAMSVLKEISYMEQNPTSRAVTNAGTFAVQAAQSGTWNVGTVTAVTAITNALPAGTNAIGKLAANSGVDIGDVDVTSIAAGTNTIGAVNVRPTTTGGLTIFRSIDLDETEEEAKGSAGQVFGWYIYNKAAAVTYVKFYNATAANVTVGTTTPVMTIPIPATAGANVEFTNGIAFDTAITVAATTGVADNDTGAPTANDLIINLLYK